MNVATATGVVLALFVTVAALTYLFGRRPMPAVAGQVLRWVAFAVTVAIAIALVPSILSNSNPGISAPVVLLVVPLSVAAVPLVADVTKRAVGATTAAAAVVMMGWGLLLGLGAGGYYVLSALILGAAAIASIRPRTGTLPHSDQKSAKSS